MSLRVGIDLVQLSRVAESLATFGDRFLARVFTADEIAYATSAPDQTVPRLAARLAAKEAAKKALATEGLGWRDIEIRRAPSGAPILQLHGPAAAAAPAAELAVSLSHEGDYATAVVVMHLRPAPSPTP
jgi:holo-[acyl-carrier protein] synthase